MGWTSISLRLAALLAAMTAAWRLALLLQAGAPGALGVRLAAGALLSAAMLLIVTALLRVDRLRWRDIGHLAIGANVRAFLLGAGLWLAPALLGIGLCMALGWATLALSAPLPVLLATIPVLALAVFLCEALPEEIALRGYAQGLLGRRMAPWLAWLLQAGLFVLFAWMAGALDSPQQWMFLPCFALLLGYARALSGNVWTAIGVHAAWMSLAQALAPARGLVAVEGMPTLQFVAFALLPSAAICSVLALRNPGFRWRG